MTPKQTLRRLAAASLVLLAAACGGGTPTTPTPPVVITPTGVLAVTITGLPSGTNASVTVTGPSNYSQTLTATTTLTALRAGTYTVTSSNVNATGGTAYSATPPSQTATVANGTTATAAATYAAVPIVPPTPTGNDLVVAAAYLTQGAQKLDGSIGLVKDRDAWLRVFVRGGNFSTNAAPVRVRFYQADTLVQTTTIPAPVLIAPTNVDEGSAATSWNVAVPGTRIQPGLSVLIDVDPANAVAETDETNNNFPVNGAPLPLSILTVPTLGIRMVPVQTRSGLGDLTSTNLDSYLTFAKAVWPVAGVSAELRPTFTSADTALLQTSGSWGRVLEELLALKTAEASNAYYIGVVKVLYTSGIAGIGYVPAPPAEAGDPRALLTWDYSNTRASVAAHELGHNFGRPHAPCGNPGGEDPQFPYSDGSTGIVGFDVAKANTSASGASASGVIKAASFTDLMGYCNNEWVSDYNYQKVLDWRTSGAAGVIVASDPIQPSLLVWGRVTRTGIELEPALAVTTRPVRPSNTGTHLLELRDEAGTVTYSARFTPVALDHGESGDAHFTFAIPVSAASAGRLSVVRVTGNGRAAELRRSPAAVAADARINGGVDARVAVGMRTAPALRGGSEVRWDGAAYPFAIVRDARTGQITGFARNGVASLGSGEAELTLSDGVRSRSVRVTP